MFCGPVQFFDVILKQLVLLILILVNIEFVLVPLIQLKNVLKRRFIWLAGLMFAP